MHRFQEAVRLHRLNQSRRQIARQLRVGLVGYFKALEQLGECLTRAESRLQVEGAPAEESDPLLERPPHY
jgi:transposase-like protein